MIAHFVYTWFGVGGNGQPNTAYSFWSGAGGCLGFLVIFAWWRRHTCHSRWCFRWGKHQVEGTPYIVCRKHHPHVPNKGATARQIHTAHHEHRLEEEARCAPAPTVKPKPRPRKAAATVRKAKP